jgi:hypothetical protein
MPYISLNLNDPIMRNNATKRGKEMGFDMYVLQCLMDTSLHFSITIMNSSTIKAASKNFTCIFSHKYKKMLMIDVFPYIDNKNNKNKFTLIPKKRKRFIIRSAVRGLDSKRKTLAANSGIVVIPNVTMAFAIIVNIYLPVKGLPP